MKYKEPNTARWMLTPLKLRSDMLMFRNMLHSDLSTLRTPIRKDTIVILENAASRYFKEELDG